MDISLSYVLPTEPGYYLCLFDQGHCGPEVVEIIKVEDYRAPDGLWLTRKDGGGPLYLYSKERLNGAKFSDRLNIKDN